MDFIVFRSEEEEKANHQSPDWIPPELEPCFGFEPELLPTGKTQRERFSNRAKKINELKIFKFLSFALRVWYISQTDSWANNQRNICDWSFGEKGKKNTDLGDIFNPFVANSRKIPTCLSLSLSLSVFLSMQILNYAAQKDVSLEQKRAFILNIRSYLKQ